jgi:hypothetical protein
LAWVRGALIGGTIVAALVGVSLIGYDDTVSDRVSAVIFFAIALGGLPGAAIGAIIAAVRRRQARIAAAPVRQLAARIQDDGPNDVWERMLRDCETSVQQAGEAVALAPPGAATDWLVSRRRPISRPAAGGSSTSSRSSSTSPTWTRSRPT